MLGGTLAANTTYGGYVEHAAAIQGAYANISGDTSGWSFPGPGAPGFATIVDFEFTTAAEAPEPGTIVLVGLALFGLGLRTRQSTSI